MKRLNSSLISIYILCTIVSDEKYTFIYLVKKKFRKYNFMISYPRHIYRGGRE